MHNYYNVSPGNSASSFDCASCSSVSDYVGPSSIDVRPSGQVTSSWAKKTPLWKEIHPSPLNLPGEQEVDKCEYNILVLNYGLIFHCEQWREGMNVVTPSKQSDTADTFHS